MVGRRRSRDALESRDGAASPLSLSRRTDRPDLPALKLPDWVHQLALTAHMGQPMVGNWDAAGVAACLVLAAAGLAVGRWGMRRRDVAR